MELASKLQAKPVHVNVKFAAGGCAAFRNPVNSSRFTVPAGSDVTTPGVALLVNALVTCAGVAEGLVWRKSAAAPATCGVAIEVPLMVLVPVPSHADVMFSQ